MHDRLALLQYFGITVTRSSQHAYVREIEFSIILFLQFNQRWLLWIKGVPIERCLGQQIITAIEAGSWTFVMENDFLERKKSEFFLYPSSHSSRTMLVLRTLMRRCVTAF